MDFGITPAIELIIFHLCYKTKWFPEEGVNSWASTLERFLAARNCLIPGQRNSTILGLWFQAGFFHAHQPALPQVHLNLQHNTQMGLGMTWFLGHRWPFDADSANHVFLLSEIKEERRFCALTSPLLCYEAVLGMLSCSVKQARAITSAICWRPAHPSESQRLFANPSPRGSWLSTAILLCSYFCHVRALNAVTGSEG